MINKTNIKFNEAIYWVPQFGSPIKVSIIKFINDSSVLVKPYSKKKSFKMFSIPLEFVFTFEDAARRGTRAWEKYKKKCK